MPSSNERLKVIVACQCCHLAYNGGVCYVNSKVNLLCGLKKHIHNNEGCLSTYRQDPNLKYCNNFFDLNLSMVKTNECLSVKKPKRGTQVFPTIPYLNFGLAGTSKVPGHQPTLCDTSSKIQKLNHTTLNQETTCVGGYQPDVCCDNIVAALKVHTEGTNRFPLSGLGTRNSTYSDHKLCTNEDNTSGSITPTMLSDAAGLDLDNNTLEKTSVLGDGVVVDGAIGDDGLTLMIMRNIWMMNFLYMLVFLREALYQ